MTEQAIPPQHKLPLDYSLSQALKIYAIRLGIMGIIILANLLAFVGVFYTLWPLAVLLALTSVIVIVSRVRYRREMQQKELTKVIVSIARSRREMQQKEVIMQYWKDTMSAGKFYLLHVPDLRGADLRGVDLRGADLRRANLRGADLRGADLRGADLRRANLRKADLREADMQDANIRIAQLAEAKYLTHATMPDGRKYEEWVAAGDIVAPTYSSESASAAAPSDTDTPATSSDQ